MIIETVRLDQLHEDPANVRTHDEKNLAAIKASLTRFKQQEPLVVDAEGIVRGGNGRLRAMRELGWVEAQIVRTNLSGAEATAMAIALNRTGELATWDAAALTKQLEALELEGFPTEELLAFQEEDLAVITESLEIEPAEAPELASGEKSSFQQMTFTLHDTQVQTVKEAMDRAGENAPDDVNENSNGNALAAICAAYLNGPGQTDKG